MNETDVAVKLENHEQEIKSLKHRMNEQEEQGKAIQEIALSVQKLAINMESMFKEMGIQGKRLDRLEAEPAEYWNTMKRTMLTAIISTLAGGIAVAIITMLSKTM